MPPLKDKVLSRMPTILARFTFDEGDGVIAAVIFVAVFGIAFVAYEKWTEKTRS
jgi:L-cystine uptake protein TcyP (sodium:dicarboxylate symporter family)